MSGRRFIVEESALFAFIKRVARPNIDPGKLTATFLAGNGALVTKVVEAPKEANTVRMPAHYHEWEERYIPDGKGGQVPGQACKTCGVPR